MAERYAKSELPTPRGSFDIVVYKDGDDEHVALVCGDIASADSVLCRVHSECLTGEVFGSLRCDCRAQLDLALDRITEEGAGVIIYLRQEGRGIGLGNKIRAYSLQDRGEDTVDANESLGFKADQREYAIAAAILADLGVSSVRLMTNNPDKVEGLRAHGVDVRERLPHWTGEGAHNRDYLEVKKARMGHLDDGESETGT
jgi:GTP cyclohydrolase II